MIIRHMQGTFGTLDGEQLRLDTGLNIIYAPNESGKSTWCAFLRAMLYGIDTSQRARAGFVPDKQKYAPWSGKPMAGELELEQGTVGTALTVAHTAPTPVGMIVQCDCELIAVEDRRLRFTARVYDDVTQIASATHERYIVDNDRFTRKANSKRTAEA